MNETANNVVEMRFLVPPHLVESVLKVMAPFMAPDRPAGSKHPVQARGKASLSLTNQELKLLLRS